MSRKQFQRNITLSYIIGGLMWGRFFVPVLALFYIASEVSLEQFGIIMGVFALATLLFEVPSGVIADTLGKKKTLLLSRLIYVIEIAIIAFFNGFWMFFIAKVISGIGVSLSSGTTQAMTYDTLKRLHKEKDHKKISGIQAVITNVAMAFVFIIGAFLFSMNPKLPALVSLPFIFTGFILTFFMKEPYPPKNKMTLSGSWRHFVESITYVKGNKYVQYLALYSFPIAAAISISLSLSSAYFETIAFSVGVIGILAFISSLVMAYSSKKANYYEEKYGEKASLYSIQLGAILGLVLMGLVIPYWGYLFYLLIPFVSGFFGVVLNHYMNVHIPTTHRATMLSVKSFFDNLAIFALFPLVGYGIKNFDFALTYKLFGLFVLICTLFAISYKHRHKIVLNIADNG